MLRCVLWRQRDLAATLDASQALLKWGSALIELAHFQQGQRSLDQLDEVRAVHCMQHTASITHRAGRQQAAVSHQD